MKFTWAHAAIAIPITIVVVFTSVLIRSMSDEKKTELVTEDYYAKEIQFQEQIDRTKNALVLKTNLEWNKVGENWQLGLKGDYDPELAEGTLTIYRPSDSSLDFDVPMVLDVNFNQMVSGKNFKKGKYQIQVRWTANDLDCYLEKNIFIQ